MIITSSELLPLGEQIIETRLQHFSPFSLLYILTKRLADDGCGYEYSVRVFADCGDANDHASVRVT